MICSADCYLAWIRKIANIACILSVVFTLGGNAAAAPDNFFSLRENAIHVQNIDHVFLISIAKAGNRLVAVGAHGVILYSDDDGKTWQQSVVPVRVTITCVMFANADVGWAAGDYGVILHTADGGKTWQMQLDGSQVNQLMKASAQNFIEKSPNLPAAATAVRRANIFVQDGPDKPFLTVLATNPQTAIVFGAYRMAVKTIDGGRHWQDISLQIPDPVSHNIYGGAVLGSTIYLAEETGLVFCSHDAGQSFEPVGQPGNATLFGISVAANGGIIAYGVAGTLFYSSSSGIKWVRIDVGTGANLTAERNLQAHQMLVTSQAGNIYLSSNNGETFQQLRNNMDMELYDLEQAADGNIVFVGSDGIRVLPIGKLDELKAH